MTTTIELSDEEVTALQAWDTKLPPSTLSPSAHLIRNIILPKLPKPIVVGARVRLGGDDEGNVIAIHGSQVWVNEDRYGPCTYEASHLEVIA